MWSGVVSGMDNAHYAWPRSHFKLRCSRFNSAHALARLQSSVRLLENGCEYTLSSPELRRSAECCTFPVCKPTLARCSVFPSSRRVHQGLLEGFLPTAIQRIVNAWPTFTLRAGCRKLIEAGSAMYCATCYASQVLFFPSTGFLIDIPSGGRMDFHETGVVTWRLRIPSCANFPDSDKLELDLACYICPKP